MTPQQLATQYIPIVYKVQDYPWNVYYKYSEHAHANYQSIFVCSDVLNFDAYTVGPTLDKKENLIEG